MQTKYIVRFAPSNDVIADIWNCAAQWAYPVIRLKYLVKKAKQFDIWICAFRVGISSYQIEIFRKRYRGFHMSSIVPPSLGAWALNSRAWRRVVGEPVESRVAPVCLFHLSLARHTNTHGYGQENTK